MGCGPQLVTLSPWEIIPSLKCVLASELCHLAGSVGLARPYLFMHFEMHWPLLEVERSLTAAVNPDLRFPGVTNLDRSSASSQSVLKSSAEELWGGNSHPAVRGFSDFIFRL